MTRIIAVALASLLLGSSGCSSRVFPFEGINLSQLKQAEQQVDALRKRFPDQDAVFLMSEALREHDVEFSTGHWQVVDFRALRYVVFDHRQKYLTTFNYTLPKGFEMRRAELVVLPKGGEPRRLGLADLVQEKATRGRRRYKLAYPAVGPGTIIEERYEAVCDDPMKCDQVFSYSARLQFGVPALRVAAALVYPREWSATVKRIRPGKETPHALLEDHGKHVLIARRKDVPALPDSERYTPYWREDGDYFRATINSARTARMVLYGVNSWQEHAKRLVKHVIEKDAIFSNAVGRITRKVVKGIEQPDERFRAIIHWVQENIRRDEEFESKDFAQVLETRRGSSKQATGLAHLMLRKAGIDSQFVLIHSAVDGAFDKEFFSNLELDVPAVLATLGSKPTLGFPTIEGLPIGLIPGSLQGRTAMKIDKDGLAGFFTTPRHDAGDNRTTVRFKVTIAPKGPVQIEERRELHGLAAYGLRKQLRQLKGKKLNKKLEKQITYDGELGEMTVHKLKLTNRDDDTKPLVLLLRYSIDRLLAFTRGEAVLQTAGLFAASSLVKRLREGKPRIRPVRSYAEWRYERQIELHFPHTWQLVRVPEGATLKNRLGQVSTSYASDAGKLTVHQQRLMHRFDLPPSAGKELRKLLLASLDVPSLVFRTQAPAASQPAGDKADAPADKAAQKPATTRNKH